MKKRDLILIFLGIAIVVFLLAAPPEKTSRVPFDETHRPYYTIAREEGKKAAEKFCEDCHNPEGVPFPEDHPGKFRCLFCHRLEINPAAK
jgi:hypothetical protein